MGRVPECPTGGPLVPSRLLRLGVGLLGAGSIVAALGALWAISTVLFYTPQTRADAHAYAHSAPAAFAFGVVAVSGFTVLAGVLFLVYHLDRRLVSAATLAAAGIGFFTLATAWVHDWIVPTFVFAVFGAYVLYETYSTHGPVRFLANLLALLWLAWLVGLVEFSLQVLGVGSPLGFLPNVYWQLLGSHLTTTLPLVAVGLIVSTATYWWLDWPMSPATGALAVAVLLVSELSIELFIGIVFAGLTLDGWMLVLVTTVLAVAVLRQSPAASRFTRASNRRRSRR